MGREIKRVSVDFNWPLSTTWKGYMNPYNPTRCQHCGGSGQNKETKQLSDDWYDFNGTGRKWCYKLTQDEVDMLVEKGRLHDLTHRWTPESGWQPTGYKPTAEEVNVWAQRAFGHDEINRWLCVDHRAKRLGVFGKCELCEGRGHYWCEEKYEELCENWKPIPPPKGEGWQVWETVSEGSPITPVFQTKEGLIEHLAEHGDSWDQKCGDGGWGIERAAAFVNTGWVPSLMVNGGKVFASKDVALEMMG